MGEEVNNPLPTISSYFHELFSWALDIGMTYEQYWEYDPFLIKDFVKAEEIRQQKKNNELWLQGIYFLQAIGSCLDKKCKYPRQPIPLNEQSRKQGREQRIERFRDTLINKSK